ncbi:hypothetical protein [Glaesserella sp.]|uniref:hypothetical protein n=1 Tax=Glaesserella sp. TaxID=2094731 RepID=UPI0035A1027F
MREFTDCTFFKKNFSEIINSENMLFTNVNFDNCEVGLDNNIEKLLHIKNVEFIKCNFIFCFLGPTIFEKVTFKNTKFEDYGRFMCPFLNQVIISEKITSIGISSQGFLTDKTPELQKELDNFRTHFYSKVDWALDISRAKLSSFDYDGIPADLFIRDPDTQFVIKKEKFNSLNLLDQNFKDKFDYVTMYLENFIDSDENDKVLTVPLARPKKFRQPILEGLQELRRLGFAEKD